jgi:uncharacterized lipoprotein YbaY
MNKRIILWAAVAIIIVGIAVYAIAVRKPPSSNEIDLIGASFSGTLTYREPVALPAGSLIEIQVRDVSREDAPAEIIAEESIVTEGQSVPIPFTVNYDPNGPRPDRVYSVFARIFTDNKLRWVTDSVTPFLVDGVPIQNVNLVLSMTGSSEGGSIAPTDLDAKTFRVVSIDGVDVPAGSNYTLEFREGSVYAKVCNSMFGGYSLNGGNIEGTLASTLMFCAEPVGIMDVEDAIKSLFNGGASASLSKGLLTLSGGGMAVELSEVRQ